MFMFYTKAQHDLTVWGCVCSHIGAPREASVFLATCQKVLYSNNGRRLALIIATHLSAQAQRQLQLENAIICGGPAGNGWTFLVSH